MRPIRTIPVRPRRGSSLLEVQVAFAVLGIGLAGICPLVVMQLRQVRWLEQQLQGQVINSRVGETMWTGLGTDQRQGQTYYLVPWQNPLAQKFAGSAQIVAYTGTIPNPPAIPCDPGLPTLIGTPTAYPVTIVELDTSAGSENPTAYVDVSAL